MLDTCSCYRCCYLMLSFFFITVAFPVFLLFSLLMLLLLSLFLSTILYDYRVVYCVIKVAAASNSSGLGHYGCFEKIEACTQHKQKFQSNLNKYTRNLEACSKKSENEKNEQTHKSIRIAITIQRE